MQTKWKVTYIDFNGRIKSFIVEVSIYNLGNIQIPDGTLIEHILKYEKIEDNNA